MRYLKSAALFLLTASSSASLLSAVAKAEQGLPISSSTERTDTASSDLSVDPSVAATVDAEGQLEVDLGAASQENNQPVTSGILTPIVDEMRSPRFDLLRTRLYGSVDQPRPETEAIEAVDNANTVASAMAAETSMAAVASTAKAAAPSEASVVAVEVIDNTGTTVEAQPESFIQPPDLTMGSLQALVVDETDAGETTGTTDDLAQAPSDDPLPTLEETEPPAVESTEEEADSPVDPPVAPPTIDLPESPDPETESPDPEAETPETETPETETPETETPETETPETEATPSAESVDDFEGLPDTLFADPNPLSFPTQEEEVDVGQNPVVTLEQAIALAYQNNQALQASLLSLEQAEAGLEAARAARRPTVGIGANLTNTQNDSTTTNDGSSTILGGTVEVEYDVLTGGSRDANIRTAALQQEVSALAVEAQQEQIRLATATAYYDLQDTGEQIRINQSFLDEAARNLRDAQLRQDVGVGTKFDTLRAEVQFANARQSLIQAQGNQRIARRDISRLLNLPPTSGLNTTPVEVEETWPLTLEESILQAFQNRAELEQQLLQADISEQQRRLALSAIRPQVSIFANYSPQFALDRTSEFQDEFQDSVSFGARFNWNLYDGGSARAQARQQELAGAIAEEQFSETLDDVRFEVEQAYFNLETNQENILTSQVAVAQAEEALSLANLRLQAGVGTQLDVLTAQSELTEAQGNNVAAILGYNRALVAIERAISNVAIPF
ncbi:MAG: TolC family protein [Cyanobacteria bacterium P01_D01_bin.36]